MATKTIERFVARAVRLYEQEREEPCDSPPAWIICAAVGELGKSRPSKYKSACEMGNTTKTRHYSNMLRPEKNPGDSLNGLIKLNHGHGERDNNQSSPTLTLGNRTNADAAVVTVALQPTWASGRTSR